MTDARVDGSLDSPADRYRQFRDRQRDEASELGRFRQSLGFELDPFQIEACRAVEAGRGVLVAAPTGAGKTVVGEFAVHLALAQGLKAFYTTPIKALSNQKYADLSRAHGAGRVGLLTGDTTVNGDAPVVVMTTEVLRNMIYAGSSALQGLGYVVMDEVHYLADRFRGPVWEEVIIHLPADVQLISLSATVSNAEEFGDWLEMVRGDTGVVVSEHRPVPLWQHVVVGRPGQEGPGGRRGTATLLDLYAQDVDPTAPGTNPPINPDLAVALRRPVRQGGGEGWQGRGRGDRGYRGSGGRRPGGPDDRRDPPRRPISRLGVIEALDRDALLPAIVFIFSRAGCEAALGQAMGGGLRLTTPAQVAEIEQVVERRCASIPVADRAVLGYDAWVEGLRRGLAAHHAGMLPLFKETVEELFGRGLVKVVFATETLALGINMPARSVVLEKLVKWDGRAHVDVTPGEYTQLTGRAGRRGIDVEGHAVVVDHPGLDPVALAGLASRRLYPLRSSFRPTYNMAVNLVARVGRERAREVLETSFAQFQADRGVVGLARQAQSHSEALEGYAQAMQCDRGDFAEYSRLRQEISAREGLLSQRFAQARRAEVADSVERLRAGDVIEIPGGRRAGYAVVLDPGIGASMDGPRPTVLTADHQVKRITMVDLRGPVAPVARVRIPRSFNPRVPAARRDLASSLRNALGALLDAPGDGPRRGRGPSPSRAQGTEDRELVRLRTVLREHPCHACPEREQHARWAERHRKLAAEHAGLVRRIEGRTNSIAQVFDRVCTVLSGLGYLVPDEGGEPVVSPAGQWLRWIYAEKDLVLAECLRRGVWDDLDAPALAAVVSTLVYSSRRDEQEEPRVPGGAEGRLAHALDETLRVWSELDDLEGAHSLEGSGPLDFGLVESIHRWTNGRSLEAVLRGGELAAGDFVRWCKQVLDVLDQLAQAAPGAGLRSTALRAMDGIRRGVVAYSSF